MKEYLRKANDGPHLAALNGRSPLISQHIFRLSVEQPYRMV